MSKTAVERAAETLQAQLADEENFCTLGMINENGYPTVSTIALTGATGIRTLWFTGSAEQGKARRIKTNDKASICVNSLMYNITLVGDLEIVNDPATKAEHWRDSNVEYGYWEGVDDPNFCVFKFTTKTYNIFFGDDDYVEEGGIL